jgi:hypothetical protein
MVVVSVDYGSQRRREVDKFGLSDRMDITLVEIGTPFYVTR